MDNTEEEKIYSTRSLPLAAFLFTRNSEDEVKLVGFDDKDLKNIHFQFKPFLKCVELNREYLFGNAVCNPKAIMDAYGTLKEQVFQLQRESR